MTTDSNMEIDYSIGMNRLLVLWRQYLGLSQKDVAFISHLDQSYISLIERGAVDIRLSTFEKILEGFQMEAVRFLKGPEHIGLSPYVYRSGDRTETGLVLLARARQGKEEKDT